MKTLIYGATIVNEGRAFKGCLTLDNDLIESVVEGEEVPQGTFQRRIDATGCVVMPGVIDDHVHFREPGLTAKADLESESRAAAYGGVTTFFEMPNTLPQTTTLEALNQKLELAQHKSHVNYSFFFGATNQNAALFEQLDTKRLPGIKLFMGASTGNMLVDRLETLEKIFKNAPLPIMTHCEDTVLINQNMAEAKRLYGDDPAIAHHPQIRNEEACFRSSALAVELATKYGAQLHVAHLTTARELQLFGHNPLITAEAVIAHLWFCDDDYRTRGTRIKCNPAVKTRADREALRAALTDGHITVVGTDHAPHLLSDKKGGAGKAASGMPMVQFSLPAMLELCEKGVLRIERVVELMCHAPARLFAVSKRGFIKPGYKADLAIVKRGEAWTVNQDCIQSKCQWSPMEGEQFRWRVVTTICNGHLLLDGNGMFDAQYHGEEVVFEH
ncbi:dihydroorotase [Hoylesella shahii]|uniref:dihydroorotase n=1 Tax=Hoylesella shahii TaxID=228603 RepID=UPI0028E63510|nr:dihydroorotase [Hoylesella shahii]